MFLGVWYSLARTLAPQHFPVAHSRRHHKLQQVNLQWKRVWWEQGNSFVKLRLSTKAIKTLKTKSVDELAKRVNLDLNKYKCGGAAPSSA